MEIIKDAFDRVLGTSEGKTGGYYIAGLVFTAFAIYLSLYISSKKRDPASKNTPVEFSWVFAIWDNFKRVLATFIVIFILFRIFDCSEIPAMLGVGFGVALSLDQIIEYMMAKFNFLDFLKSNREKFPQIPKE